MLGGEGADGSVGVDAEGMELALLGRYHLASCLRCYLEAVEPWQVGECCSVRVFECLNAVFVILCSA